jgi:hypothetical protein
MLGMRRAAGLAVVSALAVGCSSPAPSLSPETTESVGVETSPAAPALTNFATDAFAFDYPADWRVINGRLLHVRGYQWIPVVLGTGEWELNCRVKPPASGNFGGVSCGADIFTIAPGEVVVEVYMWQGPFWPIAETPPPGAILLPSGLSASVAQTARSSLWQVYLPRYHRPLVLDARFAGVDSERLRAQVRTLVESITAPATPTTT